jgi:exosortase A
MKDVPPTIAPEVLENLSGKAKGHFWSVAAVVGLAFAWVVGWYWETAVEIAGVWWKSDTFAHGLVVIPIFGWLVWRKRDVLDTLTPLPTPVMVFALALAGSAWLVAELISASAPAHFSLALVLVFSFIAVTGWKIARVLMFPLIFLFFGVPIGEFLLPVLMKYTADFTVFALRATGIPVYQEGLHFVVPNGRWSVVEACSGLRYLVASLMVGTLYAYLNYVSLKRRLLFVLIALLVPIVANWIRAYITVMIGYHFGSEFVQGFIHIVYGWVFFGLVIFLMFMIGARWQEKTPPKQRLRERSADGARGKWLTLTPAAMVVAAFPMLLSQLQEPVEEFRVALEAPPARADWQRFDGTKHSYRPAFKGQRGEVFQAYRRNDDAEVGLYIAYYAEQRKGQELVMHGNTLNGREDSGWSRSKSDEAQLPVGEVSHAVLSRGNERLESWSWYWVDGRVINSDYIAKALLALDRLTGRRDDSALVVVTVPMGDSEASADTVATTFVRDHASAIEATLRDAESRR